MISCNHCHATVEKFDAKAHPDYIKFSAEYRIYDVILPRVGLVVAVASLAAVVVCFIFISSVFFFPLTALVVVLPFLVYMNVFGANNFLNRLSRSLTQKHLHDIKNYQPQEKPVALILEAKEDGNGAVRSYFPARLESDYNVVYKKVSSTLECEETIRSLPNIKLIWIAAHGYETAVIFDKVEKCLVGLSSSNLKEMLSFIKCIPPTIPVVLHSCSTGVEEFKGSVGFAKTLSSCLPTNPIYSATAPFCYTNISGKGRLSLKTRFNADVLQTYLGGKKCPRGSVLRAH